MKHPSLPTIVDGTEEALEVLRALRAGRVGFGVLDALGCVADPFAAVEQEAGEAPLLDHVERVLGRKVRGLETGELGVFQHDDALSLDVFSRWVARWKRIERDGLAGVLRVALMHLDFAKGGTAEQRGAWEERGIDLSIHNLAAARILRDGDSLDDLDLEPTEQALVIALVESHGLAGQAIRGETPLALFAPFARYLASEAAHPAAVDCMHLVNLCDTAGVREGLVTDELAAELEAVIERVAEVASRLETPQDAERALAEAEARAWPDERARLTDRLCRLRQGIIRAGEPRRETETFVQSLADDEVDEISRLMRGCQLWYAEAATGALTPRAQIEVLLLAMKAAEALSGVDVSRPYHVSLQPLVRHLYDRADRRQPYRVRLLETMLSAVPVRAILDDSPAARALRAGEGLATLPVTLGGERAIAVDLTESEEATALLTLLSIYETRNSAAFHSVLKMLCDLYGLRKDEFDRVSNEAAYLVHMNSARSDKARMLDYAKPGHILEIGPGGGVVLDLLEERFPDSDVIGLDVSQMVIQALAERKKTEGHRWRVIQGDAFQLTEHMDPSSLSTVVLCSLLHEIYSYVQWEGERFRLEPVRELLRAAWTCLEPGGRLVIRDGVMPPEGIRIIELLDPDGREFFDLFVEQFEGRTITFEEAGDGRVKLSAPDAMEFLYTYTWGPSSFPYEVREQYGVLAYDEYRDRMLSWLDRARAVELPESVRSYLQPGYRDGLAPRVRLLDENGNPTELPDSNALWVLERES